MYIEVSFTGDSRLKPPVCWKIIRISSKCFPTLQEKNDDTKKQKKEENGDGEVEEEELEEEIEEEEEVDGDGEEDDEDDDIPEGEEDLEEGEGKQAISLVAMLIGSINGNVEWKTSYCHVTEEEEDDAEGEVEGEVEDEDDDA